MRRGGTWRFKIALLLAMGLVVPALAADPPDDGEPKSGLNFHWASWLQDTGQPAPKKRTPTTSKPKEPTVPKPAPPKIASVVDRVKAERERAVQTYLRRVTVCDELRRVAWETHDEALERKVDQLEQRAKSVYEQQTAHLPGHNVDLTADERSLDRHLGTTDANPDRGASLNPATGNDRGSQAAIGEGKP